MWMYMNKKEALTIGQSLFLIYYGRGRAQPLRMVRILCPQNRTASSSMVA